MSLYFFFLTNPRRSAVVFNPTNSGPPFEGGYGYWSGGDFLQSKRADDWSVSLSLIFAFVRDVGLVSIVILIARVGEMCLTPAIQWGMCDMLFYSSICNMLKWITFQRESMGKAGDEADVYQLHVVTATSV